MSRTQPAAPPKARPIAQLAAPDLATFFLVSLDLLCIRDSEYRFVKVNEAWETLLGYTAAELEGRPMLDFIHPDDHPSSRSHMQRLIVEDEVRGYVNRYRGRDGTYHHLEWRARRVGDLVYGAARDVTDQVALEHEKAEAMAAVQAASRAKSDFLANMSHEIRTPLNGVIGVAGALAKTRLEPDQCEMVDLIVRSGETLERLVSDILDLSKIEAGRLELETREFDLRRELDPMLGIFRLRADEKGLAFSAQFEDRARGVFLGDSVRVRQLVANLLSNAVKFTAEGSVGMTVEFDEGAALDQPGWLTIKVRDTGVGFDKTFADGLFQRFSQADGSITRKFGGTGLGLSICQSLAEMMGGQISGVSSPGQGATFTIRLPLVRSEDLVAYDRAGAACGAANQDDRLELGDLTACRILLAEDHPINRRVVELILSPLGVALTAVEDGAQAVDAYEAGTYDLILMDMQMPNLDGLAATRQIRAIETRRPVAERTPIIMLSANAMSHHAEEALAAGADLHLAKPVIAERLIAALAAVLADDPEPLAAASAVASLG